MSDLDILLPEPWFSLAARALRRSLPVSYAESPTEDLRHPHQLMFRDGHQLLELHHSPAPRGRFRVDPLELWRRSTPALSWEAPRALLGPLLSRFPRLGELRLPAPRDEILLWLSNSGKGGGAMNGWLELIDLRLLLERESPSRGLTHEIQRAGLVEPWRLGLWQLGELGLRPPQWHAVPSPSATLRRLIGSPRRLPIPPLPRWREQLAKLSLLDREARRQLPRRLLQAQWSQRRARPFPGSLSHSEPPRQSYPQ